MCMYAVCNQYNLKHGRHYLRLTVIYGVILVSPNYVYTVYMLCSRHVSVCGCVRMVVHICKCTCFCVCVCACVSARVFSVCVCV